MSEKEKTLQELNDEATKNEVIENLKKRLMDIREWASNGAVRELTPISTLE